MMKILLSFLIATIFCFSAFAQNEWKKMSADDLQKAVPEKAPVINEQIETELRTASGIIKDNLKIFGVVIITAGYEADGKYTHYFKTDAKITVGDLTLEKGDYIFGYKRIDNTALRVYFFKAESGEIIGAVKAENQNRKGAIYSFLFEPATENKGKIFIGRFAFDYKID